MTCASEIYTNASVNRIELVEFKKELVVDLFMTTTKLKNFFPDNRNLEKAIEYINNYYARFFSELDKEHKIYDLIMDYIASFEYITDLEDPKIIANLSDVLEELDECFDTRIYFYYDFLSHINQIFEFGILTDKNYLFSNYVDFLDDEKNTELLSLIPRVPK